METENLFTTRVPEKLVPEKLVPEKDLSAPVSARPTPIISGWRLNYIRSKMIFSIMKVAWECYRNPLDVVRGLKYLSKLRQKCMGGQRPMKIAYTNGQYYLGLYNPGWNGEIYKKFMLSQLNDFKPVKQETYRFNNVIMAITKKCALQCEHCFEWESLNKKESLSTPDLLEIVDKLQKQGVSEIQFSGGEPLLKVDRIIEILHKADKKYTSFWIDTSGFKFTAENAKRLKAVGLTGIMVSLDHYDPTVHNRFRGFKDAYYWAETAVRNALKQDLVVTLSVCITRELATRENLLQYMNLAKEMGVAFVQFLEPKAVGHYRGKDVLLQPEQIKIVEEVFEEMNCSNKFLSHPIITYHGYYQRRSGCFSGGYKGFYVDTDGDINPCPFCQRKSGNVLDDNFEEALSALKSTGCSEYPTFSF